MEKIFIKLDNNVNNLSRLINYMQKTDLSYDIPLSERVDIVEFTKKILDKAVTLVVVENDEIIAMSNFYCNDIETKKCYVTNISITKEAQDKGYHMDDFAHAVMKIAQKVGMKMLCAETTDRRVAILHRRLGFVEVGREEIDGVIHYYNCIKDIDAWLEKDSARQITILNL